MLQTRATSLLHTQEPNTASNQTPHMAPYQTTHKDFPPTKHTLHDFPTKAPYMAPFSEGPPGLANRRLLR